METLSLQLTAITNFQNKWRTVEQQGLYVFSQRSDLELNRFVDFNRPIGCGKNYAVVVFDYEVVVLQIVSSSKVEWATSID